MQTQGLGQTSRSWDSGAGDLTAALLLDSTFHLFLFFKITLKSHF